MRFTGEGETQNPFPRRRISPSRTIDGTTGFEALIGYLYLKKNYRRIVDLIKTGLVGLEEAEEKDERPEE